MKAVAVLVALALASSPRAVRGDDPAHATIPARARTLADRGNDPANASIPAKARALADRGRAFHDAGDYPRAIAAFTQAYVIAPSPALLFNLAQAYRLQGNCDDAALMYRRYLAARPDPEQRALAELHLASVERCLHKIALHIPVETASGRLIVPLAPDALVSPAPAPVVSHRAQLEKNIGTGLAIAGGVSLGIAAYYAVQAHDASDDVAAAYAQGGKWKDVASIDERGKSAATMAKLFGAGGAVGVVGGIVTYLIGRHDEQPPVTVATTRHGVSVGVRWAF
jgi:tetratricopeptide (TPR) repeat protein